MAKAGILYAINGAQVLTPDEELWTPIVSGTSLTARQKRSPYRRLEWRRQVTDRCEVNGMARDWFGYDNTTLTSLICRPPGRLAEFEEYADAVCQSVTFRQRRGVGTEVVATFLVCVG